MKTYGIGSIGVDQEEFMTKSRSDYYTGNHLNDFSGIDLSCNQLKGFIPEELGSMNWIRALNLSNNELDGPIPKSLSNLSNLESLDLSHNFLTGLIPRELAKLHYLASFSVAYNNLSGAALDTEGQFSTFNSSSYEGNPNLCGPPLPTSCTRATPPAATQDIDLERGSQVDLILVGSLVVSFVTGFWGSIAVLYFKRSWNRTFFLAVDKYTNLLLVKVTLLIKRARNIE
ncbi:hypothetical protein LUZ61_002664 [Rhynchospora tenuis]|uniref:Uncharacterized protein n=1 Tax=Rhynchospora tenuis TaxID=198213 RepID=A0AAD5ZJB0_9POAL|nr:hypothetical protein LUZ61_002664 [Rhynchospora tenuis]